MEPTRSYEEHLTALAGSSEEERDSPSGQQQETSPSVGMMSPAQIDPHEFPIYDSDADVPWEPEDGFGIAVDAVHEILPSIAQVSELPVPARPGGNDGQARSLEANVAVLAEELFEIGDTAGRYPLPTHDDTLREAQAQQDSESDSPFDFSKPAPSSRPSPGTTSPQEAGNVPPRIRRPLRSKRTLWMRDDDDDDDDDGDDEDEYRASLSIWSTSSTSSYQSIPKRRRRQNLKKSPAAPLGVPKTSQARKRHPSGGRYTGAETAASSFKRPPTREEIRNATREAAEMSDFLRRGYHSIISRKKKRKQIERLRAIARGGYISTDAESYSSLDSKGQTRSERVARSPHRGSSAEEEGYNTDGKPIGTAVEERTRKEKIRRMEMGENEAKRLAKKEAREAKEGTRRARREAKAQEPKAKRARRGRPRKSSIARRSRTVVFSESEYESRSSLDTPPLGSSRPLLRGRARSRRRSIRQGLRGTPHLLASPVSGIRPGISTTSYPPDFLPLGTHPGVLVTPYPLAFPATSQVHPWGTVHPDLQSIHQAHQGSSRLPRSSSIASYQRRQAPQEYHDPWSDSPLSAPLPPVRAWASIPELEMIQQPDVIQQPRPVQPQELQRPSRLTSYSRSSLPIDISPQSTSQVAQEPESFSIPSSQFNRLSLLEQRLAQIRMDEHPDETLPPEFTVLQQHPDPETYLEQLLQAGYRESPDESTVFPEFWRQFEPSGGVQDYPASASFSQPLVEGESLLALAGREPGPSAEDVSPLLGGRSRQFRDNFDNNDDDLYTDEW